MADAVTAVRSMIAMATTADAAGDRNEALRLLRNWVADGMLSTVPIELQAEVASVLRSTEATGVPATAHRELRKAS